MNKDYFSAQELAGQPGLPATAQSINTRAKKDAWISRPRKGKGGGKEYHISSLPSETRNHLAKQAAERQAKRLAELSRQQNLETAKKLAIKTRHNAELGLKTRQQAAAMVAQLQGIARERAQSKLLVLAMWQTYVRHSDLSKTRASYEFLTLWANDQLDIPTEEAWIKNYVKPNLTLQTLYAWEREIQRNPRRLCGNYGHRKGQSKIDTQPELKEFVVAMIYEYPHIKAAQLLEAIETRFTKTGIDIPSKRSLERWIAHYIRENESAYTAITNPDKWKNKFKPAYGTLGVLALNEKWEFDSTPADVMLTDGRYQLIGGIDVYSRRAKLIVSKTSTAASVAKLLRDCILDWGIPQTLKTDNGKDYTSLQIKTALKTLGIHQDLSAPFSPWEKPHIERFFKTFSHGLLELMPGYIGHNVADRSQIEDRKQFSERLFKKQEIIEIKMSSEQLQAFADDWIDNLYMHRAHQGLGGKTPFQMISEWSGSIQQVHTPRALDILLSEVGERVVGKDGIRLDGFSYIAPELGAITGQRVHVRKDPIDVGTIYVFKDGAFICIAEDARYVGIKRQEIAHQASQHAAAIRKQAKQMAASAKRSQSVKDIAQEILATKREQNNVSMLPKRTEEYRNEHIDAATEAASLISTDPVVAPMNTKLVVAPTVTNPQDVYRRWLRLEARVNKGEQLNQDELRWFKTYPNTPAFKDMKEFFEEFGLGLETGSN